MNVAIVPVALAATLSSFPAWAATASEPATPSESEPAPDPEADPGPEAAADDLLARYAPAPVDGPALRLPASPTVLYVDATLARSDDLSALPYIAGTGRNLRFAAGGAWRWRRFVFSGEVPFTQVTTLSVTAIPGGTPLPEDMRQTATSLGDVRLGVDWTEHLSSSVPSLLGGFGLRGRLPTHTTRFRFHLIDGSLATYSFPYYFNIEPTAILGASFGRFTVVLNQGAVVMLGPDGDFSDQHIVVPTLVFWDTRTAVSYAPLDVLAASLELGTDVQVNHVGGLDFQRLNGVRAAWLAPALQLHLGDYRLDLIARLGLSRGADLFGVIVYAGTTSYTLRVSRTF